MQVIKVNDRLSVATQPDLSEFKDLAADGFVAVINNRPDGEEPGQPSASEEAEASAASGMPYTHIPVTGASITEQDVRDFQAAMAVADGPVLAHCRSGTRSLTLYAIGEVLDGRLSRDALLAFGTERGIDLRGAEAWLARNAKS